MNADAVDQRIEGLKAKLVQELENPNLETWEKVKAASEAILSDAIAQDNEQAANRAWFLDKVAETRLGFVRCYGEIRRGKYYDAWCGLERVEISLTSLERNPFFNPSEFQAPQLAELVASWQKVFPYSIFFSPEFVIGWTECSICGSRIDPWSDCTHEAGRVYGGKECVRIVRSCELVSISLVTNPVQKYSVPFLDASDDAQGDHYKYVLVKFVADRVVSPFDGWSAHWTEAYHPHELFTDRSKEDGCPCDSGRRYVDCCLLTPGVRRPHLQASFDKNPPSSVPNAAFVGYGEKSGHATMRGRRTEKP